jgi:hypothetical protein
MRPLTVLSVLSTLLACAPLVAQQASSPGRTPALPGRLFVSGFGDDAVHTYRARDGAVRDQIDVQGPQSIVEGPDGLLYVCAEKVDRVVRIDPQGSVVLDIFVQDVPLTPADENGPLDGPTAAVFGPDGDLFVASFETDQILRFDGASGAYEGVFVTAGLGGLDGPDAGTKFGQDGFLYVPSFWNDRILRYDSGGAFVDEFVSFREGGLRQPRDLVQHRGDWYVASSFNNRVLRYTAAGDFVGLFATINRPYSLAFNGYDDDLYVVSLQNNAVRVFDGESGVFLRAIVPGGTGGLDGAVYLCFVDG